MAKEDDKKTLPEVEKVAVGADVREAETKAKLDADEKAEAERLAKSLEGLVKMKKDGKHIHAHPTVVKEHQKNGWVLA